MSRKMVEGHASKQAPANRTTFFEVLKFHITGNSSEYDFSDFVKACNAYNSGREVTAYIERHGFRMRKGISERVKMDESRNCGMTPIITQRYIGTWKAKDQPFTQEDIAHLIRLTTELNGKEWKEVCTF